MPTSLEIFDYQDIRERFYVEVDENHKGWTQTHVKVFDKVLERIVN